MGCPTALAAPDRPSRKALDRLDRLVKLAEGLGLYLDESDSQQAAIPFLTAGFSMCMSWCWLDRGAYFVSANLL